jgi:hypothetical protein
MASSNPIDISVATSAANLEAVPKILEELTAGFKALSDGGSEELRQDLSTKARDLMLAFETPRETSMKHIWGEVSGAVNCFYELQATHTILLRPELLVPSVGVSTVAFGRSWRATVTSLRRLMTLLRKLAPMLAS